MLTDVAETVKLDFSIYNDKMRTDRDQTYRLPPLSSQTVANKPVSLPSYAHKSTGLPANLIQPLKSNAVAPPSIKVQQLYEDVKPYRSVGNSTDRSADKTAKSDAGVTL